jgi:hypothetical protein
MLRPAFFDDLRVLAEELQFESSESCAQAGSVRENASASALNYIWN